MINVHRPSFTKQTAYLTLVVLFLFSAKCFSQAGIRDSAGYIVVKPGSYNKSKFYKLFYGEHYRKEWNTPITVKKVSLDTIKGGLTPYQTGGSRQTKSIRVTDKNNREYTFRSVDKTFGEALPDIVQGTFTERLADDQVTISHPYSALAILPLTEAAHIYHAAPELVYVPKQPALKEFNDSMGNIMYMLEQRPDENWATAPNFGNSKNIVSTEKMLEKILEDNDNFVDQKAFARARLFDMLIGDWGRHEDQWRWATFKDDKKTTYVPIPRDRDNAFTKFDGLIIQRLISVAGAKHLQTFDYNLKHVAAFNFPARHLDHHLLNQLSYADWQSIAAALQNALTDAVIDNAVKQFPPEVYNISGPKIAAKLKARRAHLAQWAKTYYNFLSTDVEITGTEDRERFEIRRLSATETDVQIFKITKDGDVKNTPLFHRVFKKSETNEIRFYGIGGNDEYVVSGRVKKGIKIRLIGGKEKDTYTDESHVSGPSSKTKIYDNPGNEIAKYTSETAIITSRDTAINRYDYKYFRYNRQRLKPILFYNNEDRIYIGAAYLHAKNKWRKTPFANVQYIDGKYSLSQKAFSATYFSDFLQLVGKWNLRNYANYDEVRWTNFFGLGNETSKVTDEQDYNRVRSEELIGKVNLDRIIHNRHRISIGAGYQTYRIINDTARFLAKQSGIATPALQGHEEFAIGEAVYVYQNINDSVLPVKGVAFRFTGSYTDNLGNKTNMVGKYGAETNIFIPLSKRFSFAFHGGGSTLSGDPEFYQYNRLGGSESLRGVRRDRYYGNSTAFTQSELRYIKNFRSFLFNGKIGLFALYDAGRVWLKGEDSDKWHQAVGGGLIISPFNRVSISAAYAVSSDDANIHIRIMKPF